MKGIDKIMKNFKSEDEMTFEEYCEYRDDIDSTIDDEACYWDEEDEEGEE